MLDNVKVWLISNICRVDDGSESLKVNLSKLQTLKDPMHTSDVMLMFLEIKPGNVMRFTSGEFSNRGITMISQMFMITSTNSDKMDCEDPILELSVLGNEDITFIDVDVESLYHNDTYSPFYVHIV